MPLVGLPTAGEDSWTRQLGQKVLGLFRPGQQQRSTRRRCHNDDRDVRGLDAIEDAFQSSKIARHRCDSDNRKASRRGLCGLMLLLGGQPSLADRRAHRTLE